MRRAISSPLSGRCTLMAAWQASDAQTFSRRCCRCERSSSEASTSLRRNRVDVVLHQLRRDRGDGEDVAGEALDLETDGAQLLDVGFQHRAFGGAALVEHRRQKLLVHRRVRRGAVEVAVVENPLVRDVLVDEAQTGRRVDDDVAHAVLADDAPLQVAEPRLVVVRDRWRFDRGGLFAKRRLNDALSLEERRELGPVAARRIVEPLRRKERRGRRGIRTAAHRPAAGAAILLPRRRVRA